MRLARNVFALVAGLLLGGAFNMALVMFGPLAVPPPAGVDVTDMESLRRSMHLFEPRHFVMPFLAHALGTFVGAFIAWLAAASHRQVFALAIGVLFLAGGITNAFLLPAPAWFIAVDLVFAYLPMAWLGGRLARRVVPSTA